jgi:hypothetical protein
MSTYLESRHGMRFPVKVRVIFKWVDENGNPQEGEGRTLNMSERGALVIAPTCPPRGTPVELKVFLPRISITPFAGTVRMDATVVRNEETMADEQGFAIEGQATELGLPPEV